ncbi:MAG: hypothetical protein H6733_06935 [Alphaproteobacteria bacterium]|nr:hypothetical protein [Alphaproteobacteria bacterium]
MRTTLLLSVLLASTAAHAALVDQDDPIYGVAAVTLDTDTGLVWLDLPASSNYSYVDMQGELLTGGGFEGWRYATPAEVDTLLAHGGYNAFDAATVRAAAIENLMSHIGITYTVNAPGASFYRRSTVGMYDVAQGLGRQLGDMTLDLDASFNVTYAVAASFTGSTSDTFASDTGHWLVRDVCTGSPDSDADGVCDALDLCYGDDANGDADVDGLCEPVIDPVASVTPGAVATFTVHGGPPGTEAVVLATIHGIGAGGCLPAFGMCTDLVRASIVGRTTFDGNGDASVSATVPTGARNGTPVFVQAAFLDRTLFVGETSTVMQTLVSTVP